MKRKIVLYSIVAVLGCSLAVFALTNGTLDTTHSYVGIVMFPNLSGLTGFTGGNGFVNCSGTLIAPRVFLTAAHCLSDGANFYVPLDQLLVTFNATNSYPPLAGALKASSLAVMSGFRVTTSETPDINDIGVVILAQPVHNITPARLAPFGFLDTFPSLNQASVSLLGYGVNEQLVLSGNRLIAAANFVNLSDTWFKYKPGSCSGDDGGPTLLLDGPTEYQVGIHSSITSNTGHGSVIDGCGPNGYDTRVDTVAVQSFIQQQVAANQ